MVDFPKMSTVNELAVSGAFVITKHWRLTFSSSPPNAPFPRVADTYAWENTRARAIAHSGADYWSAVAQKVCIPSFATLLPEDRINGLFLNVRDAEYEYHDPVTQRVKMGCTDDSCTNCKGEYPMAIASCNTSVTCQVRVGVRGVRFECKAKGAVRRVVSLLFGFGLGSCFRAHSPLSKSHVIGPWKQMLSPGRCFACSGGLSAKPLEGFEIHPGPPAPDPYRCAPCSQGICFRLRAPHTRTHAHAHERNDCSESLEFLDRRPGVCVDICVRINIPVCVDVCVQRRQTTSTPTPIAGRDRGAEAAAEICQRGQSSFGQDWHAALVIRKTRLQQRICPPPAPVFP